MTIRTRVIVLHSYNYLLCQNNINTFDVSRVPVNKEEEQIIQEVQFAINLFYTKFNQRIFENIHTVKQKYENLSDCLNDLFLHSFPYEVDWSHIIGYMVYHVEASIRYIRKNSAENTLDFAWSILWTHFKQHLNAWIQEQGGWPVLTKYTNMVRLKHSVLKC